MKNYKLSFSSAYNQFYLADAGEHADTGADSFWDERADENRLAVADGLLGVGIVNDEQVVNAEVAVLPQENTCYRIADYDHIVEASLNVASGVLRVLDCPDSHIELEIAVNPGWYRVRVYGAGFNAAYTPNPTDRYLIELWEAPPQEPKLLREYTFPIA